MEYFMNLNSQEIETLRRGERLEVDVPEVGARCVVLRTEELNKMVGIFADDIPMEVVTKLVDTAMAEEDSGDPLLAGYQSCRP
jgi:hypothetical protein